MIRRLTQTARRQLISQIHVHEERKLAAAAHRQRRFGSSLSAAAVPSSPPCCRRDSTTTTARISSKRLLSQSAATETETVPVIYVDADGSEKEVNAPIGSNLLEVAHDNGVELEGACGGELACSTCHLVFDKEIYDTLPEMEDDEEDMLDLAFEVTDTSRLGCQIIVRPDFAGMKVRIPDDGF